MGACPLEAVMQFPFCGFSQRAPLMKARQAGGRFQVGGPNAGRLDIIHCGLQDLAIRERGVWRVIDED